MIRFLSVSKHDSAMDPKSVLELGLNKWLKMVEGAKMVYIVPPVLLSGTRCGPKASWF